MKNLIRGISLILLTISICRAQTVTEELKTLNQNIDGLSHFSVKTTYSVFPNYYSTKAFEVTEGVIKKSGPKYISVLGSITVESNDKYIISVDEDRKHIIVADISKAEKQKNPLYNGLDSLFKRSSDSKLLKLENSINRITLNFSKNPENGIAKMEVYYDSKNYFLNKLILYYSEDIYLDEDEKGKKDKPRLELKFEHLSTANIQEGVFSSDRYFKVQKKELVPSAEFKGYTILDQRLKR